MNTILMISFLIIPVICVMAAYGLATGRPVFAPLRGWYAVARLAWITSWAYAAVRFSGTARVLRFAGQQALEAYRCGRDGTEPAEISYAEGESPNEKIIIFPYDQTRKEG